MAQYKIVDNVNGLTEEDWTRVVAVFVNGPEWELKKFPWYKKFGGVPGVLSRSESCFLFLLHLMRFFFFSFFLRGRGYIRHIRLLSGRHVAQTSMRSIPLSSM